MTLVSDLVVPQFKSSTNNTVAETFAKRMRIGEQASDSHKQASGKQQEMGMEDMKSLNNDERSGVDEKKDYLVSATNLIALGLSYSVARIVRSLR